MAIPSKTIYCATPGLFLFRMTCEGFIRHRPPGPTLESASPYLPQGSTWPRFNIDLTWIGRPRCNRHYRSRKIPVRKIGKFGKPKEIIWLSQRRKCQCSTQHARLQPENVVGIAFWFFCTKIQGTLLGNSPKFAQEYSD